MRAVARICFSYWLKQANVLFVIGGKANNTDIYETFRAIADALREHVVEHGPTPVFVVIGRGGPRVVRGMGAFADSLDALGLPYRVFGFDSAMSEWSTTHRQSTPGCSGVDASSSPRGCESTRGPERGSSADIDALRRVHKGAGMFEKGVSGFPYYVRHRVARAGGSPLGHNLCAQHFGHRVAAGHTGQPCLLAGQRGLRHVTGTQGRGAANEGRRHPDLRQRPGRT
jgi:hypothetical protein